MGVVGWGLLMCAWIILLGGMWFCLLYNIFVLRRRENEKKGEFEKGRFKTTIMRIKFFLFSPHTTGTFNPILGYSWSRRFSS